MHPVESEIHMQQARSLLGTHLQRRGKCLLTGPEDNDMTGLFLSAEAFDGQV